MKIFLLLSFLILAISCSTDKSVYWCGDHACINKKERKAYFKKTMIVEKKIISKKNKKDLTKSQEIIKKAKENEKKRIANEKKIKKEKKLEQKRLKKEEKKQAKKIKKTKKKNKNKLITQKETKVVSEGINSTLSTSLQSVDFEEIKDQIIKKNLIRSYPDINDIPN